MNNKEIIKTGLWQNNPALVQLLGMCPLMAVSTSTLNGLGLGLATTLVLVASNVSVSLARNQVKPEIRVPVFMLLIAAFTTVIDLSMNAYVHELHKVLGIFIPLIVTNCFVLGRALAFAAKNPPAPSALDGLMMGLGFTAVLSILGALREVLGKGTLFAGAHNFFGQGAAWLETTVIQDYSGFLFMILPPGAFLALGFLIALKNLIDQRREHSTRVVAASVPNAAASSA